MSKLPQREGLPSPPLPFTIRFFVLMVLAMVLLMLSV